MQFYNNLVSSAATRPGAFKHGSSLGPAPPHRGGDLLGEVGELRGDLKRAARRGPQELAGEDLRAGGLHRRRPGAYTRPLFSLT